MIDGAAPALLNPQLVGALLAEDQAAIAAALWTAAVLVPGAGDADGHVLLSCGRAADGRRLLHAFSDLEALTAWDRHPANTAAVLDAAALEELLPGGTGVIVINPAGPGAHLIGAEALPALVDPAGRTESLRFGRSELVDPLSRRPFRAVASDAHDRGREAARSGMLPAAIAEFERSMQACGRLGDRLHGAVAALELAACLQHSGQRDRACAVFRHAGEVLGAIGESDLAVRALLAALDLREEPVAG